MKSSFFLLQIAFCLLLSMPLQAQHDHSGHTKMQLSKKPEAKPATGIKDIFIVYGNCGMCKKRIEGALTDVKGVQSADWIVDSKVLTVQYDDQVISLDEIKKLVVAAGHDTDKFRTSDETYKALPGCCQYERPKKG